jgi:hypothetical protein
MREHKQMFISAQTVKKLSQINEQYILPTVQYGTICSEDFILVDKKQAMHFFCAVSLSF